MKLRNLIGKALVVSAVAVATMIVGAVSVFAQYGTATSTPEGNKTTTIYDFTESVSADVSLSAGTTMDCGIYIKANTAKYLKGGSGFGIASGRVVYFPIKNDTNSVVFTIVTPNSEKTDRSVYIGGTSTNTVSMSANSSVTLNPLEENDVEVVDGKRYLKCTSTSDFKVKKISIVEDSTVSETFSVSGTITNSSSYPDAKVTIGDKAITVNEDNTFSVTGFVAGEYAISCDKDYVDISVSKINVSSNVTDLNIELTDKDIATLSGKVDTNLTTSGNIVVTSTNFEGKATIENGAYTISVPQNNTYTFSLDTNEEYIRNQYKIKTNTVEVGTTATTFNLDGEKITSWDFSKLPAKKFESAKGTYKGIVVDASTGKFDVQPGSNRIQFNATTIAKIPVSSPTDKVVVTSSNSKCKVTYYADYAVVVALENDYITEITIQENKNTPALGLSASGNTLTGTIYNANDSMKIQSITIQNANDTTKKGEITKVAKSNDGYTFTATINSSAATTGNAIFVYQNGDKNSTLTYAFNVDESGNITTKS